MNVNMMGPSMETMDMSGWNNMDMGTMMGNMDHSMMTNDKGYGNMMDDMGNDLLDGYDNMNQGFMSNNYDPGNQNSMMGNAGTSYGGSIGNVNTNSAGKGYNSYSYSGSNVRGVSNYKMNNINDMNSMNSLNVENGFD